MRGYDEIVLRATGCPVAAIPAVLDIMRQDIFHSTLDWQTQAQLEEAAREAWQILHITRQEVRS